MKIPTQLFSVFAALTILGAANARAMDMDMQMGHKTIATAKTATASQASTSSSLVPVAHEVHHMHGVPILETELTPAERLYWESYNTTSYMSVESPHKRDLYVHLILSYISMIGVYPIVLVLKNLDSKWFFPALSVYSVLMITSLSSYSIFINSVPDLYPNNAYSKMSTGLFFLVIIHLFSSFICVAKRWLEGPSFGTHVPLNGGKDIPMENLSYENGPFSPSSTLYDFQDDNHGGRQHNLNLSNDSFDLEIQDSSSETDATAASVSSAATPITKPAGTDYVMHKLFNLPVVKHLVQAFGLISKFNFNILNYGLFFYSMVYIPTGVAVLCCLGKGSGVFNLLAHFIKGGVFFGLGILSLARYCGGFTKLGWAWNKSYITQAERGNSIWYRLQPKNTMITMEMMESSLILFYGSTNVFLEHLASTDGAWTAKDLQHVSIAFMYIGAGLCGVITELKLANWRRDKFFNDLGDAFEIDGSAILQVTPGFSPNPFPAFTIFWTGLLMSQHAQASMLSTNIHVQWGSLLSYGSFFRLATFVMLIFFPSSKDKSTKGDFFKPIKPFTELITSFCLLCGGLVFMESTDSIVAALEYRGLTAMFTLNVSVGVISLLMGWIMVVFSFKDWLKYKMYGISN